MNKGLTGLERHESINDRIFIFGWSIPLTLTLSLYPSSKLLTFVSFLVYTACGSLMDIAIVLDGSNSIYPWEPIVAFLRKLLENLDIGPQSTQASQTAGVPF